MSPQRNLMSGLIWFWLSLWSHCSLDCDNGKVDLQTDLPDPEDLMCHERWSPSQMNIPDIDTKSPPTPADNICMNASITYSDVIPTRGRSRPVEAESGEYLYCPPQRWIHNLKIGALVLLYHPCVSSEARRGLTALARSCLSHYILTPHPWIGQLRPIALVSWGRSLEMSHISSGLCDWLISISYNTSQASTSHRTKYSLYLTKPAPLDRPVNIDQETSHVDGLKYCCMDALHLKEVPKTRKIRMSLKQTSHVSQNNDIHPNKLNRTESEKHNIGDNLSQNNTREMTSLLSSNINVTQSENASKDLKEAGAVTKKAIEKPSERHEEQTHRKSHIQSQTGSRRHRIKTDTDAQGSAVLDSAHMGGPLRGQRTPIKRTDEAVWAAAALGFLLVLLTLSVLHTRLYRHCRSSTSLYWNHGQQDYENVADIIRRRLKMVGRRKRRCSYNRRQESVLLSNSSTDENSE